MGLFALRRGSLVLGPLLLAASTFFWVDGRYGITGASSWRSRASHGPTA